MLRRILVLLLVLSALTTSAYADIRDLHVRALEFSGGSDGDPGGGDLTPEVNKDEKDFRTYEVPNIYTVVINYRMSVIVLVPLNMSSANSFMRGRANER